MASTPSGKKRTYKEAFLQWGSQSPDKNIEKLQCFYEEYLFCKSLPTTTRGEDVFQTLKEFIEENGLDWLKLVGICTDGAPSMMGIRSGFQSLVKQVAPQVFNYHCLRQRYALAVKTLPPDLLNTLSDIVKIVNHIRGSATNSRLFKVLCDEVGATLMHFCNYRDTLVIKRQRSK
ncbi:zinc finger BED domain-containing protein 5-like [Ctenocephalides felis]|uniref:zinc finger BED domain-containing protein 5-like n=1 Tax=Ctenocephalides felis TaxID=7515 RepID=UPI000E6E37E6|nr:zinc finger BED domain-containing protein 5-like [Ctenocephalides felis]